MAVIDMKTRQPVPERRAAPLDKYLDVEAVLRPKVPLALLRDLNELVVGALVVPEFPQIRFHVPVGQAWEKHGKARIYFEVGASMGTEGQGVGVYFDTVTRTWGSKGSPEGLIEAAVRRALALKSQGL